MFNLSGLLKDRGELAEAEQWYRKATDDNSQAETD
ncbi:hypothetical protein AB0J40_45500 [Amycolatopsis sp. NPDC049691]